MTQRILQLDHSAILKAREQGLTFSPRRHNRLRCNQAPELGLVSAAQAEMLRAQIWPHKGRNEKRKRPQKNIPTVHQNNFDATTCPACHSYQEKVPVGEHFCTNCGRAMNVKEPTVQVDWRVRYQESADSYTPWWEP